MNVTAMIMPKKYFFDRNGKPLAFGKIYTKQAGTEINKPTYTTEVGDVENSNPIILNGEGYAPIYIKGSYTIVVDDANDNNIWTEGLVSSSTAEQWTDCETPVYISPASFKVAGNLVDVYTIGRTVRIDNDVSDYAYSTVKSASFAAGETTVVIESAVIVPTIIEVCVSIIGFESVGPILKIGNYNASKTLAEAKADKFAYVNKVVNITDRAGASFTYKEDQENNGINIIACSGVPALSLVLNQPATAAAWGILFDDSTDNKLAIAGFLTYSSSKTFNWDAGICKTSEKIPIAIGSTHNFNGTQLKVTAAGGLLLDADNVTDFNLTGALALVGSADGSDIAAPNTEILLNLNSARRYTMENITCLDTLGVGFLGQGKAGGVIRSQAGKISNCSSYRCQTGWDMRPHTENEYVAISNGSASDCFYGAKISAGNIQWNGGTIADNAGNVTLTSTGTLNELHGIMTGVSINHASSWLVKADDVINGFVFGNCNIYGGGNIQLTNSKGVIFNGGLWDCDVINNVGAGTISGKNKIFNMTVAGAAAALSGDNLAGLESVGHISFSDAIDVAPLILTRFTPAILDGNWVNFAGGRYGAGYRLDPYSGMVFLRGIVKDGTGLIFTLPVGYRPGATVEMPVNANSLFGALLIQADGAVYWVAGDTTKFSLDGVSFSIQAP
jgi:hypothetical protein